MKLDYRKTLLIGLGFFTVSIVWAIYNVAVPLYLDRFGIAGFIVGAIMALDNLFAVVFQPVFGALSDKTRTRYGRRMPFLLIGIPLSAIAFFLVPFTSSSMPVLIVTLIALNFFMSIYRAPTVALMPDVTPRNLRSKANGIINFMGGLGTAISLFMAGMLFKIKEFYPFVLGSGILILTVIIMYNFIQEPAIINEETAGEEEQPRKMEKGQLTSLIFLLVAIFFWFTGFNAVETFFSTYGKEVLGIDKGMSSFLLMTVSALFLLCAIPSGLLAGRLGRKNTIMLGLCALILTFAALIFVKDVNLMFVFMGLGGISWALININSYPMVVEMTSSRGIGRYTGYYYFFSMLASIISPILFGYLKDILGDAFLFIYATVALIFALFFMMLVKHGEAGTQIKGAFENLENMD